MIIGICENDEGISKPLFEAITKANPNSQVKLIKGLPDENEADVFIVRKSRIDDNLQKLAIYKHTAIRSTQLLINNMLVICCFISHDESSFLGFTVPTPAVTDENKDAVAENFIEDLLSAMQVKRKLIGCCYLKTALMLSYPQPESIHKKLSSELYPAIAKIHHTKSSRVERAIRTAINDCYDHGSLITLNKVFDSPLISTKYAPSNGELIFALADKINYNLHSLFSSTLN